MKKLALFLPIAALLLAGVAVAQQYQEITVTANVQPYVSVWFSYNAVDFGEVYPNNFYPAPFPETRYVLLETNVYADEYIWYAQDWPLDLYFASEVGSIPTTYDIMVGTTPQLVSSYGSGSFTIYHQYWLYVPPLPQGVYAARVAIEYRPL